MEKEKLWVCPKREFGLCPVIDMGGSCEVRVPHEHIMVCCYKRPYIDCPPCIPSVEQEVKPMEGKVKEGEDGVWLILAGLENDINFAEKIADGRERKPYFDEAKEQLEALLLSRESLAREGERERVCDKLIAEINEIKARHVKEISSVGLISRGDIIAKIRGLELAMIEIDTIRKG